MTVERFCLHPKKRKAKGLFVLFFILLLPLLFLILLSKLPSALLPLVKADVTTEITQNVQAIIRARLTETPPSELVSLSRDANGNVTALQTDSVGIAALHAEITESVIAAMGSRSFTARIPIGNLSENVLFTGRGPSLPVRITVSPQITCDVENSFAERGINQTLHRVVANIRVEVYAWILMRPQKISVEVPYCLAETVIVGKVPDAYTRINRFADDIAESEIDDIYDFGAETE